MDETECGGPAGQQAKLCGRHGLLHDFETRHGRSLQLGKSYRESITNVHSTCGTLHTYRAVIFGGILDSLAVFSQEQLVEVLPSATRAWTGYKERVLRISF